MENHGDMIRWLCWQVELVMEKEYALKSKLSKGDLIVVLGGDNYRIGMGGASVSSTNTGEYSSGIELNAVQNQIQKCRKEFST